MDRKEKFNQIIDELLPKIESAPENETLRRELGAAYMNAGRYQESIIEFQEAGNLDSQNSDTFHQLGIIFDRLGQYQDAINYYMQTIKISPENPDVLMDLGLVYDQVQDYENAINIFKKIIELVPEDIEAHFHLGLAYDSLEDGENAITCTMQAEKLADANKHVQWKASSNKSLRILFKRYQMDPKDFE
jgi:tetratricopeptide (TPR) repeat protein